MKGCFASIVLVSIILIFLLLSQHKEESFRSFEDTLKPGAYIPRPEETGITRPLWGKLMPVKTQQMRDESYGTFGSLPQCSPPYHKTKACFKDTEVPYEYNKI